MTELPLRVVWADEALAQVVLLGLRAPAQARHVWAEVEHLARLRMAGVGRPDPDGRPGVRYRAVPPQGIVYMVRDDELLVIQVLDARQRHEPWLDPPPFRGSGAGRAR